MNGDFLGKNRVFVGGETYTEPVFDVASFKSVIPMRVRFIVHPNRLVVFEDGGSGCTCPFDSNPNDLVWRVEHLKFEVDFFLCTAIAFDDGIRHLDRHFNLTAPVVSRLNGYVGSCGIGVSSNGFYG